MREKLDEQLLIWILMKGNLIRKTINKKDLIRRIIITNNKKDLISKTNELNNRERRNKVNRKRRESARVKKNLVVVIFPRTRDREGMRKKNLQVELWKKMGGKIGADAGAGGVLGVVTMCTPHAKMTWTAGWSISSKFIN